MFLTPAFLFLTLGSLNYYQSKDPLIVVLFDGFRWDYIDKFPDSTHTFRRFVNDGVKAKYMLPVNPTNTYPNMYSIATGRHPESHQIFDNIMLDKEHNEWFLMHPHPNVSHSLWYEAAEPLWVTAVKANKKVAMYYWLGCEALVRGHRPTYCQNPDSFYSTPVDEMVETYSEKIEDGLKKIKYEGYSMMWLYFEHTDHIGHKRGGPESEQMESAVEVADQILKILMKKMENNNLTENTNVILISDHGMSQTTRDKIKYVDLEGLIDFRNVDFVHGIGSSVKILPKPFKEDIVYKSLKRQNIVGIKIYKYDEIPTRFHMKEAKRIKDWIYIFADEGYFINKIVNDAFDAVMPGMSSSYTGFHGYDNQLEDMRAIFFAKGPAFLRNRTIESVRTIDLYNLMSFLIGVEPHPNNGTFANLVNENILKPEALPNM